MRRDASPLAPPGLRPLSHHARTPSRPHCTGTWTTRSRECDAAIDRTVVVSRLFVASSARGQGIGALLMARAVREARARARSCSRSRSRARTRGCGLLHRR
ncbi:GNAT family N-acetyltransferase [Streptomyces jumonjinensis]|uniref:GNAT family N-acetyltransferase n=1 Tax=Streptomyces jumonjinensis TaxID=1945 RepID=UPI003795358D